VAAFNSSKLTSAPWRRLPAKAVLPGFRQAVAEAEHGHAGREPVREHPREGTRGYRRTHRGGLVTGLQTFEPLLLHVGQAADIAARHFQTWSTGSGGATFAQSLGQSFDKVIPVLTDLAQAVAKIVSAFAPIGSQVVGVIGLLSDAITSSRYPYCRP